MKKILLLALLLPFVAKAQTTNIDEFQTRRDKVISMLDSTQAIVLKAINSQPLTYDYIQEHNFFYLTGINSSANTLLMSPKGIKVGSKKWNTILFYSDNDVVKNFKLGPKDTALKSSEFKLIFSKLLPTLSKLYYSAPDLNLVNDWISDKAYFMEREMKNRMKSLYPSLKLESAEYFVGKLRMIKSKQEIEYIRKASNITADGLISAIKIAKPGVWEYEMQAAVEYEYTRQGALLRGFPSIIGSGLNNLILHYNNNNCQTKSGDLVVMDVGAKYMGYSSDITRTIPISGKFTEAQKEIYSMVLQVQKMAITMIKPGVNTGDIEKFAVDAFKKLGYQDYYTHGLSHPVGLDVHDISTDQVLKPGMVLTIEPGLYFSPKDKNAPEKFKGFGVRIEDTILVTEDGYEILSSKAPKEIIDIERLMKRKK